MSDLTLREIEDFSELGQPIEFRFNGSEFFIPAVTPRMSRKLIKLSREISKKAEINEKSVKEYMERGEDLPEELENELNKVFDFQLDFILQAGLKRVTDGNIYSDITFEELEDSWSNKMTARVFKLINENMVEGDKEKKS